MTTQMFTGFRIAAVAVVASVGLLAASPARADNHIHYTSPTATSQWPPCDREHPCDFRWLVEGYATSGDAIVLLPGTYGTPAHPLKRIDVTKALRLTGPVGKPRPRLYVDGGGKDAIVMCRPASLANLEIHNITGGGSAFMINYGGCPAGSTKGKIENVAAFGTSDGCWITEAIARVRNTVCYGSGYGATGIRVNFNQGIGGDLELRGVTGIATGDGDSNGVAIHVNSGGNASAPTTNVEIVNTIARGRSPALADLELIGAGPLSVDIGYSNFRAVSKSGNVQLAESPQGSNQSAEPKFASAEARDFRQAVGSPTIDAGVVDGLNGLSDFEGDERTIGESTDIGADEFAFTFRSGGSPETGSSDETGGSAEPEHSTDGPAYLWVPVEVSGRLSRRAWRARRGARLSVRVTQPANVRIRLQRRQRGRWRRAGRVELGGIAAGEHRVRLRSPLPSGRKLRPGRYRLVLRAAANGLVVRSTPIRFRVLEPRR